MANINLFDNTGMAIDGYSLPDTLLLDSFAYSNLQLAWVRKSDGDQFHFAGRLKTLSEEFAVPEPSTLALLFAGLGILGWAHIAQLCAGEPSRSDVISQERAGA